MKYNIGQTHKVDLGSPVTYAGNTIYKGGTVVSLNGSLYVAKYNIPPTDEGPLKSDRWELINATTPYGYVNAVTDLGWDNTGHTDVTKVPDNINIFMPSGRYSFSLTTISNANLIGEYPEYSPIRLNYSEHNGTYINGHDIRFFGNKVIHVKNIAFGGSDHMNLSTNVVFDDCYISCVTELSMQNSFTNVFNHCSFHDDTTAKYLIEGNATAILYDCCLNSGRGLTGANPLGTKNVIWYNPLIKGLTAEQVGSATLYNPTYLEE